MPSPPSHRTALLDAAATATRAQRDFARAEDSDALARILAQGTQLITDWDRTAFLAATAPVRKAAEQRGSTPPFSPFSPDPDQAARIAA